MRKPFFRAAILPPLLLVLARIIGKIYFKRLVRGDVIAPRIQLLEPLDLHSRYKQTKILCVGCTSGIGLATAKAACEAGASLVVLGRKEPTALVEACEQSIEFLQADLSSMRTVKVITDRLTGYDFNTVLFTVGIISTPERRTSEEGIELDTAVSFLSRYVMTQLLLTSSSPSLNPVWSEWKARIFIMGFPGNPAVPQLTDFNWEKTPFKPWEAHMNTVIGNDALVENLSKLYPSVNVYGLNPGVLKTDIIAPFLGGKESWLSKMQQFVIGQLCPSVEDYVNKTLKHLLVTAEIEHESGTYFNQYGERIQGAGWLASDPSNTKRILAEADKLYIQALAADTLNPTNIKLFKYQNGKPFGEVEIVSSTTQVEKEAQIYTEES